jgi:transcriptional regulator with XRE-family HTH domain
MAPKTPKPVPISQALAATIARGRQAQGWTQEQLAEQMQEYGFSSWSRTTVAEVEGRGRGRQVSVPELFALAQVFQVGVEALLWDRDAQGDDDVSLEMSTTHRILSRQDLLEMLIAPDVMALEALRIAEPAFAKVLRNALTEAYSKYTERVLQLTAELRDTAAWIEQNMVESMSITPKEKS